MELALPRRLGHTAPASASPSCLRERTPSLLYAPPRCVSTVFSVTNSAWAIWRLVRPAHLLRLRLGGMEALVEHLAQQLGDEERVARRGLVAGTAEGVGGVMVHGVADPAAHRRPRERRWA